MTENPKSGIASVYDKRFERNFLFIKNFDSTEGRLEKEVWAYTAISFIAEMGGALGLFIGVSFLSVWDFWEYVFNNYKQHIN